MQVTFPIGQANGSFYNVNGINKGLEKEESHSQRTEKDGRQDRVTMPPQGKMMSAIENLNKQKEALREKRSELVTRTMEGGGDLKSIKEQLQMYDEQLEGIDQQIAQITADFAEKAAKKAEEKGEKKDENKTQEELDAENMSNIAYVSDDLKQAKTVSAVKNQVQGEAQVAKAEVKISEIDLDRWESKALSGEINVEDIIKHKKGVLKVQKAALSQLQDKASGVEARLGEALGKATEHLNKGEAKEEDSSDALHFPEEEEASAQTMEEGMAAL